jgi:N-acetylglucosamine kinase-like BadF-type ATPase
VQREWVASLAGIVGEAAAAGDPQALAIVRRAGADLGQAVGDVARLLDLHTTPVRVSTIGGVFRAGRLILDPFEEQLRQRALDASLVPPHFPAVIGALLLAYRAEGITISKPLLARLEATCRARSSS